MNHASDAINKLQDLRKILEARWHNEPAREQMRAIIASNNILARIFGPDSSHVHALKQIDFASQSAMEELRGIVDAAVDEITLFGDAGISVTHPVRDSQQGDRSTVFVIHGRQRRHDMHDFLRAVGLKPLEWSQVRQHAGIPNPYTWQIVDTALSRAGAIVALMTPDDEARLRQDLWTKGENALEKELLHQPRQNVLFEAGVAYGRNPQRTVLVRIGAHRPMSDLAGHSILQLNNSPESRQAFVDGLRAAGCSVDLSGSDWFRAGNFE